MEKYGRSPKYVILDSQSYLDLYAYVTSQGRFSQRNDYPNSLEIYTSTGVISPIVLPQANKRIQVIDGDPLFTARITL